MMPRLWKLAQKYPEVHSLLHEVRELRKVVAKKRKEKNIVTNHLRWEYCVVPIRVDNNKVHTLLNDYGEDGWQLFQITEELNDRDKRITNIGWFKRPKYYKPGPKQKVQEVSHGGTTEGQNNG